MPRKEEECVAEVLDLIEADNAAKLALAFAAAAHVEAQRDIAEFVQHSRRLQHARRVTVAAKAMEHDESRTAFPRF
jgi:hypothetical protein